MIAGDIEASRALAVRIGEVSAHDGLAPEIVKLCAAVSETIVDPDFPGALVPAVGAKGAAHIFAVAPTAPLWRRLSPVLLAFAGPTLTSFSGVPGELPAGDTVADLVRATGPAVTATLSLRALAENVDLFVMSWLSAKHAATDFIRKHRGGRPLLYAQGRGFSSILRAIEDHLRQPWR